MSDRPPHRLSPGLVAAIAAALLAAGAAAAWFAFHNLKAFRTPPVTIPTPTIPNQPPTTSRGQVYWLAARGETIDLAPVPARQQQPASDEEAVAAALQQLLAGPQNPAQTTAIPAGTKLLGVKLEKGGVRVNLSAEFTSGGGSASMQGRLGQIIYTATSLNPQAPVWLEVAGKPLEVLGGEGIMVEQPLTRRQFAEDFDWQ